VTTAATLASTNTADAPLRLRGARYQYAGSAAWVLDGIDLEVRRGRVTAVVGANESGKSTLCLVASGLAPSVIGGKLEGSVTLDGRETRDLKPYEAAQRCGVLFQNPLTQLSGTVPTVWEEIAFGPRNVGLDVATITARVDAAVASLRIGHLVGRDPARLSGGQAQLVALAGVLALQPHSLVLDEPTSQLDPEGTRLVGDAIRRIARDADTAVLVVEHKTGLLSQIADDGVLLDAGRIVVQGPIAEVLGDPRLSQLGIDPPPAVRLRRALEDAGVSKERIAEAVNAATEATRAAATA
jgi:energy-coupling factor transport system ATP-binding protein